MSEEKEKKANDKPESTEKKEKEEKKLVEEEPVVTHHELELDGRKLVYSATVGRMPIIDEEGEIDALMSYTAYTLDGAEPGKRPLMFSFNGGPGSPSLWLHLGALGPYRIPMGDDATMPPPPYSVVPNLFTWLEHTDLVFIDPVGTGYSRAKNKEAAEKYWGVKADVESVSEFIRMYLTRCERWGSPLFLVGESYGTTRAAGISGYLVDRGVAFNGIVLVSSILNFQTARFHKGNDLPYLLFLPTYTATAFYHGKLDKKLGSDLIQTLREVEAFAMGEYASALSQGDLLPKDQRQQVVEKLARYTGLKPEFVDNTDLRIHIWMFCKELLRDQKRTVGRLDSRFKGIEDPMRMASDSPEHDPSMSALMPPYTAAYNHYNRSVLGYKTDLPYEIFGGVKKPWNWGSAGDGHPDTSESLRKAMAKNPHMKVYIASGYYDLATPYWATEYTLAHMGLDPEVRGNVTTGYYESGHMMYIHEPSLEQFRDEVAAFISASIVR